MRIMFDLLDTEWRARSIAGSLSTLPWLIKKPSHNKKAMSHLLGLNGDQRDRLITKERPIGVRLYIRFVQLLVSYH